MKKIDFLNKNFCSLVIVFFSSIFLFAQENQNQIVPVKLTYNGGGNYTLVERTDLRRYDNGKYVGLVSREVRSFINRLSGPEKNVSYYEGSFYVQEETKRSSRIVMDGLHDSIPSAFKITNDGNLIMTEDQGYPSFRSFPAFSDSSVKIGDKWQSKAERCVDPLNKGIPTKLPLYVEYTFLGETVSRGENVYILQAKWATRYGFSYKDPNGDRELKSAFGNHNATMHISKISGYAIVVRDSVDETFVYEDGKQISFKGTISMFTEYPPAVDREKLIPAIQRVANLDDDEAEALRKPVTLTRGPEIALQTEPVNTYGGKIKTAIPHKDIKFENTEAGIRLTMQNLKFKANSAELLPGEESRLDMIAGLLKEIPGSQFLVEGHTASTGNEKGEQILSEQRSREIARELSSRGIAANRFIVKGSGSRKPVADNSTAEGKAQNRRVEITILE